MAMDGNYSSFNNSLLKEERYQKFVRDANSPKVLVEDIKKKYEKHCSYNWWWGDGGTKDDCAKYAFKKLKEEEVKPNEDTLSGNAISVSDVKKECENMNEGVKLLTDISAQLEILRDVLGEKNLKVDEKNYGVRIDELIEKTNKYKKIVQEFSDAVDDRAQFVHDFQVCVQKDYIRYFGNESSYGKAKTWNRERDGWNI